MNAETESLKLFAGYVGAVREEEGFTLRSFSVVAPSEEKAFAIADRKVREYYPNSISYRVDLMEIYHETITLVANSGP